VAAVFPGIPRLLWGLRASGNVLFMCWLIWRDKSLMKAAAVVWVEQTPRRAVLRRQIADTQRHRINCLRRTSSSSSSSSCVRKSLVASAPHEKSHLIAMQSVAWPCQPDTGRHSDRNLPTRPAQAAAPTILRIHPVSHRTSPTLVRRRSVRFKQQQHYHQLAAA